MLKFKNKTLDKMYIGVGVTLLVGLTIFSFVTTNSIKEVESKRLTVLDSKEVTKLWVVEDIRSLLQVKDERTYKIAKDSCHFTDDLKKSIYGNSFDGTKYFYGEEVSFIDAQYSLENDKYLLLANVKKGDKNYILNILVSLSNNLIYDISFI